MIPRLLDTGPVARCGSLVELEASPATRPQCEGKESAVPGSRDVRPRTLSPADKFALLAILSLLVGAFIALIVPTALLLGIKRTEGGPLNEV